MDVDRRYHNWLTENLAFFKDNTAEIENVLLKMVTKKILSTDARSKIVRESKMSN